MKIDLDLANNADNYLGLYCLPKCLLGVSDLQKKGLKDAMFAD